MGLEFCLAEAPTYPDSAFLQFVRGRILGWLGRDAEAMAAYEAAIEQDPASTHARFQRGVLLAKAGRETEAYQAWARAATDDPSFADAAYNAGQAAYNLGCFDDALRFFASALRARPEDFEAYKKLVQALRALGRDAEAEAATARLIEMWRTSADPAVRALNEVVVDQIDVCGKRVLAWQNLRPQRPELHYELTFAVLGQPLTVQLESSAEGRERGMPYVLGLTRGEEHRLVGPAFGSRPPYSQVKGLAVRVLERVLVET